METVTVLSNKSLILSRSHAVNPDNSFWWWIENIARLTFFWFFGFQLMNNKHIWKPNRVLLMGWAYLTKGNNWKSRQPCLMMEEREIVGNPDWASWSLGFKVNIRKPRLISLIAKSSGNQGAPVWLCPKCAKVRERTLTDCANAFSICDAKKGLEREGGPRICRVIPSAPCLYLRTYREVVPAPHKSFRPLLKNRERRWISKSNHSY
jgi:hypothetical protein